MRARRRQSDRIGYAVTKRLPAPTRPTGTEMALREARRELLRAVKLAPRPPWEDEHRGLLSEDVRACRDVVEAIEQLLAGNSAPADALLVVEEAQQQIAREQLHEAIRDTARRHGWRAL